MQANPTPLIVPLNQLKIWLLIPHVESNDPNIQYYYDFSQGLREFQQVFDELKLDWKWQPVTIHNFRKIIDMIATSENGKLPYVLNLCDGDEVNGVPGISVIHYLQEKGLCFSGASTDFYINTTSKIAMKRFFDAAGVATPKLETVYDKNQPLEGIFDRLGSPLIIKPSASGGGSMGISVKNVVSNENELQEQIQFLYDGYHGWNLTSDGLIIKEFINGPEFTPLIFCLCEPPHECIHY